MNANPPESLVFDPRRLRQNLLVNHAKEYVFIDNPKSASSTVKRELWDLERAEGRKEGEPLPTAIHGDRFLKTSYGPEIRNYFSFAVVRNPYSRVLSAYLDKIDSERAAGRIFRKQARIANEAAVTFPEFVRTISASTPIEDDRHWTLQVDNLLQGSFRIDLLGSVENLDRFLATFAARYQVEKVNPGRSTHATGAVEKISRYYDEETRQLVAEKYRRDFETFGYSFELADCTKPPAFDGQSLAEETRMAELAGASLALETDAKARKTLLAAVGDPFYGEFCRGALALRRIFADDAPSVEEERNPLVIRGTLSRFLEGKDFAGAERAAARLIELIPQWREGWVAMAAVAKSRGCPDSENSFLAEALEMTWDPGVQAIRARVESLARPAMHPLWMNNASRFSGVRLLQNARRKLAKLLGK